MEDEAGNRLDAAQYVEWINDGKPMGA